MKRTVLQLCIFLFVSTYATDSAAQVTITESNFPRPAAFVDSVFRSTPSSPALPAEGAALTWDYSNLVLDEIIEIDYYNADNYEFPEALNVRIQDLSFQGFLIEADIYENIDSDGWYTYGRSTFDVTYPITSITGGPNDILYFPEVNDVFSGRVNTLQFPMTYEDQWTQSRKETIPFELSVAAFGLDQTPGARERTVTNDRDVVGYGDLILPNEDGSPTGPMPVLLIKVVETYLDSVFLGGAPAPPAILSAFGLVQGASTTTTRYLFYKRFFGAPLFSLDIENDLVFYRPQGGGTITGVQDINLADTKYFPNPVSAGDQVSIEMENQLTSGIVRFYDLAGRPFYQTAFDAKATNQIQINIPSAFSPGMYMYQVLDDKGIAIGMGKAQVN